MVRQFLSLRGPCPSLYCARNHGKAGFVTATMSDSPSSRDSSPRDRRQGGLRVLGGSLGTVTKRAFARRGLAGADIDRQSVVWGKSVSVRVDLGGRRLIKKKNYIYPSTTYLTNITIHLQLQLI